MFADYFLGFASGVSFILGLFVLDENQKGTFKGYETIAGLVGFFMVVGVPILLAGIIQSRLS